MQRSSIPGPSKRRAVAAVAALTLVASLVPAVTAASAATGATVDNGYFRAYATSACSAGHLSATVHVTSEKNYLDISLVSAGLYNSAGALVTSTGIQGYGAPVYTGQFYAGGGFGWSWVSGARAGGRTVRFYVDTPKTTVTPVSVSCAT
jgi:hypothetical protein